MSWNNSDGLYVKFGREGGQVNLGGEYGTPSQGGLHVAEFKFDYTDCVLASAILGSKDGPSGSGRFAGAKGVVIPAGARIEKVEVVVETVFTSSGTLASATLDVGLIRLDRTTSYDDDGFVAALAGSALTPVGKVTTITVGSTGAGAFMGTSLANAGYIVLNNDQHGTHPLTAGKAIVRVYFYKTQTNG